MEQRIKTIRSEETGSKTDRFRLQLDKLSRTSSNFNETRLIKLENRVNILENKDRFVLDESRLNKKIKYIEEQLIKTTEIAILNEKTLKDNENSRELNKNNKSDHTNTSTEFINFNKQIGQLKSETLDLHIKLAKRIDSIEQSQLELDKKIKFDKNSLKDLLSETKKLIKSNVDTNSIEKEIKENLEKQIKKSYETIINSKMLALKKDLDYISEM
mmetsp:Transcript_115922/g.249087  ORF Transcript_115922/g.249087 Transcript_115922/m.249087 type:complete len:215 (+) Transcript_115922:634-1278(+)